MNKFYITTAIPYSNDKPHIGFALEIIQADVFARYNRKFGNEVFFLTGVDEHGLKVFQSAKKAGVDFQDFVDKNSAEFAKLKQILNISNDDFIRTTDRERHWPGAQKLWKQSSEDIYIKEYEGLYCVGCEAFITEKELIDGLCPEHKIEPELVKESNYFFRLSKYKNNIRNLIERDELKIIPETRKNEVLNLLDDADDFSISRPKEKIPWGVPVPGNEAQIMYVWFDALANYITAIGYGRDEDNFRKWWPADLHVIGKGILRFHVIYWPAMLLSAGLDLPKSIFVHGYVTINGEKISKSLGNVISPEDITKEYGIDPLRYYLLREIPSYEDGDFSLEKFKARYNGDLANNLGNLVSRVQKLVEDNFEGEVKIDEAKISDEIKKQAADAKDKWREGIENFKLHDSLAAVFSLSSFANQYIDFHKPWTLIEDNPQHLNEVMENAVFLILKTADLLEPFLPDTSAKIKDYFEKGQPLDILFPKIK